MNENALRRAFARVKENHGCAGADGVSLEEFQGKLEANLEGLGQEVESGAYFAWPLRRILIEKQPGSAKGLPGTTISRPNSGTEVPRKLKLAPLGSGCPRHVSF